MVHTRQHRPIEALVVDAVQSRDTPWVGDDRDRQLAASVDSDGLLQDIIVRPLDDETAPAAGGAAGDAAASDGGPAATQYAVIAGSRRYHAAMEAGHETVPCKVVRIDDVDAAWQSLQENTTRRDLSEQEIAQQLRLIFELVRPLEPPTACPACDHPVADEPDLLAHCAETACELPSEPTEHPPAPDTASESSTARVATADPSVDGGAAGVDAERQGPPQRSAGRFVTDQQAIEYIARRYYDRSDEGAISLVEGHLRTAQLPPELQALFKPGEKRTASEQTALGNYNIDTTTMLGSGEGKSGTSREVVALFEEVTTTADAAAIDPTEAVLEAVGSLTHDAMSEQELRRSLRQFRHDVVTELDTVEDADTQQAVYRETLTSHAGDLQEVYETVEPDRPFKKVDVLGPETQRHSRWHALALQERDISAHGELVRQLYQERLEALADERGWH